MINIIDNGCIQPNIKYKVEQGTIIYNGITYTAGDHFIGLENFPYYDTSVITDLIPDMTSNTTPSGECIGDGVYRDSYQYQYWKAFNKSISDSNDAWISKESVDKPFPHWIGYKFDSCVICNKIIIQTRISNAWDGPSIFNIEASNNLIDWIILYKVKEKKFSNRKYRKCYKLNNNTPYMYYRIFIKEQLVPTMISYVAIGEITMLYEQDTNIIITTDSKIQDVSTEYNTFNIPVKHYNKFNNFAIEYEIDPYDKKTDDITKFKEIGIELPAPSDYGEVLKVSNIRMFKTPLRGNQKYNESNN